MAIPKRLIHQTGRYALVDGIPFKLPVGSEKSPALMAVFTINHDKTRALLPGNEIHPLRLWKKALLVITVIDYRVTVIGTYIEFSIAIACTHGPKPALPLLPALLMKRYGTGQFVYDLPVSTEVSVKGGKGIWGMPKHQASLNFVVNDQTVSSQYDLDGQLAMKIEIDRPQKGWFPIGMGGVNYCEFRGMLMKSYVYFKGKPDFALFKKGGAKLTIGDHPRLKPLKDLEISPDPIFTAYFPETSGVLDDHFESWFISEERPPQQCPEGLESVVNLGLNQDRPEPPKARF
jgi:hypothetical protein